MGEHSRYSPSGFTRWSACPGSINFLKAHPELERKTSVYADEGTKAHTLGEKSLKLRELSGNPELDIYVQYCLDLMELGGEHWIEAKLEIPGTAIFGTADFVHFEPNDQVLRVVDLKYGAGVGVEILGNTQLRIYALQALLCLPNVRAERVEITIIQPRYDHSDGPIRTEVIDILEILEFEHALMDAVRAADDPDAPLVSGDHCRWCDAKPICPALKQVAEQAAIDSFSPIESIPEERLSQIVEKLPLLESWIKSVREYAYRKLCAGESIPGFKLVAKRAHRKWDGDDTHVANTLISEFKLMEEDLFEKKLKSPAQVEKLLDKGEARSEAFTSLYSQESSGCSMAPTSDRRAAVSLSDGFIAITDETLNEETT